MNSKIEINKENLKRELVQGRVEIQVFLQKWVNDFVKEIAAAAMDLLNPDVTVISIGSYHLCTFQYLFPLLLTIQFACVILS